ncbi:malto-oligosyltrehalose trehalohydrolase [Actinotalea sp.]|uniref:malto-oligosyltrehalose trehalohydrolase n=1 Tax=Actinotalea sp. TaxID=1872145 RepID=UPI003567D0B1
MSGAESSPTAVGHARVWAPEARTVDLHTDRVEPMRPVGGGWWEADSPLHDGSDYAFSVDGGPPRPDPRSPWQPHGVHGPSRAFDTGRHRWTDEGWAGVDSRGAVTYELHVGTFTPAGTLDAAIEHLEHLADLGVDLVELMPLAAFPGRHGWGYDGVALWAVHEAYGGPAALQRFVDAAHHHGLGVCLDVVYNHLGPSGNYLATFGPYFTDTHHTPWGSAVNLDASGSAEVRAFIVENALRWFAEFHVDALRLDAVHALADDSPRHLLAELSDTVAELSTRLGRPLSLVAESDENDARTVQPTAEGGLGMTGQWADDVHHALHAWLTGERHGYYVDFGPVEVLAHALTRVFVHEGGPSTFRGVPWGAPVPRDTDARRFVVFAANHDQIGNRAVGDRPASRVPDGVLAAGAAVVLLSPFSPMLFMGDEWGTRRPFPFFSDHQEPELAEAIRVGRTAEFAGHGWAELYGGEPEVPDPQAPGTVESARLDWSEPAAPTHARMLAWHRTLIALRRVLPGVLDGDLDATQVEHDSSGSWILVRRPGMVLVASIADGPVTVPLAGADSTTVLASWEPISRTAATITLPGAGAVVLTATRERS